MAKGVRFKLKDGTILYPAPYYPIGAIYLTVGSENPGTLFGGTWQRMTGGYLYGVEGTPNNSTYKGTASQPHTLTEAQMPYHTHSADGWVGSQAGAYFWGSNNNIGTKYENSLNVKGSGGNQSHSHNIAFLGIYVWKRIA